LAPSGVLACLAIGVLTVASSPEAIAQPHQKALPRQIWAVALGSDSLARVRSNTLVRLRSSGINTVLAIDLNKRQLTRLRNLIGRARMTLLVPQRGSSCRRTASATCVVKARSRAAALRLSRRRGVDLAVVRIAGPKELDGISARRGRILALAKLGRGRFNASTWRRAIDRAVNDPHLDLAVQPLGRAGERALASYVRVFAPGGAPTLQDVDGGPNYYAKFANGLPTAPSFFPISTWGSYAHFAAERAEDKAVGLNGYVWVASDAADMARIRAAGMWAVQDYDAQRTVGSETAGWLLGDEVDMQNGPSACPGVMNQRKASLTNPGGRFSFSWYGKGVIFWETDAQAACFVNYDDVNGADIYWFTDPNVCTSRAEGPRFYGLEGRRALTQAECRRARNYGDVISDLRRLDAMDGVRHPIWQVLEVGCPFSSGGCITPAQARAAVWHSLIAGARGIEYFQHSFGGPCRGHHVLRDNACYQPMIDTITSVNAQIRRIAPALNGPRVSSGFSANSAVRAVAKWDGRNFYVLAGSMENAASMGNFAIPCVGNATATVIGENRTLPVTAGSFSDSFADGNAVHIYRIHGGSTCGLS
jgi:hypothetical protein